MIFQQIRNATIKITYQDKVFLIDPWLAKKGSLRSIESPDDQKNLIKNPTADLPISIEEIVNDVDVCIITHNHIDHFDNESMSHLNRDILVFVQNEEDQQIIKELGFTNVSLLDYNGIDLDGIMMYQTDGQHGETKATAEGPVSGIVLQSESEDTLYICGDTIWYEEINNNLDKFQPQVIVLNACDARLKSGRLIMDLSDIKAVYEHAKGANIIVSHLEAVNHAYINRHDVKEYLKENQMKNVYVPDDGEKYQF